MKIEISITKQHIVSLVLAIAIVAGISYAVAQTSAPDPGHSIGEIDFTGGFTVPSGDIEVSSGDVIVSNGDIRTTELLADTVNATDVNVDGNIKLGGVVRSSWSSGCDWSDWKCTYWQSGAYYRASWAEPICSKLCLKCESGVLTDISSESKWGGSCTSPW